MTGLTVMPVTAVKEIRRTQRWCEAIQWHPSSTNPDFRAISGVKYLNASLLRLKVQPLDRRLALVDAPGIWSLSLKARCCPDPARSCRHHQAHAIGVQAICVKACHPAAHLSRVAPNRGLARDGQSVRRKRDMMSVRAREGTRTQRYVYIYMQ